TPSRVATSPRRVRAATAATGSRSPPRTRRRCGIDCPRCSRARQAPPRHRCETQPAVPQRGPLMFTHQSSTIASSELIGRIVPTQEFFTPVAFDFLWEQLGAGEPPYPLKVVSHGRTESERRALRQRAEDEFAARGIEGSPVEGWLDVLGRASTSVDALFIPEFQHPPVGAIAASD